MTQTALKPEARDSAFADLVEDMREAHWLLDRLVASLRNADEQAADLARLMTRVDRSLVLLEPKGDAP